MAERFEASFLRCISFVQLIRSERAWVQIPPSPRLALRALVTNSFCISGKSRLSISLPGYSISHIVRASCAAETIMRRILAALVLKLDLLTYESPLCPLLSSPSPAAPYCIFDSATPACRSEWQGLLRMTTAYHPADAFIYEFGLTVISVYLIRLLAYWILPPSWAYVVTLACLIAFINDNPWKLSSRGLGERYVLDCGCHYSHSFCASVCK
jgi:hypothetical protein